MEGTVKTYRVFACVYPRDDLFAEGWKNIKASSPADAAVRAALPILREAGFAMAYVGIGGNRHENGIPLCVRGFNLEGKGSHPVDAEGRAKAD
jgi:hypothetical protein